MLGLFYIAKSLTKPGIKSVPGSKSTRGMTLLEISIVIVILAALMLFSIPNMRGMHEKNKMTSASRELVSLIRFARSEAITSEHETEIRIDKEKARYRLDLNRYKSARIRGSGDIQSRKREQIERIRYLPRDIYFKKIKTELDPYGREKIARIVFYPDGSALWAEINLESHPKHKESRKRQLFIEVPHATALPNVTKKAPELEKSSEKEQTAGEKPKAVNDFKDLESLLKNYGL